ncbi:ArsR/SmtB family transcription factor [Saccharomonospora piscinae]|uniref:Transcriptional regulator n=1 Tax=Saccharomonospora piscinae TaxID=687388 RepID=A0A1V9A4W7_SACPI|nr:winged helix-turn-helix domain-containing protein [Saccharomonospora piscinae]OQO92100.1 transcriptional regulator [Saccharomonospora piscinae]TLW92219.1 winged helix-turn-helix transcriptional regulator [Saccharomonospora piscinae]
MVNRKRRATEAEARALASGIRLRIIRLTYATALTNKELAQRLGRDPATTLHHVRKLVDTGFLAAQPARRGTRGAKEIPYRSTGLSWRLDTAHDPDVSEAMLEAFLAELAGADPATVDQWRLVAQVRDDRLAEFRQRLEDLLEEFSRERVEDGADRTALYVALYPSR